MKTRWGIIVAIGVVVILGLLVSIVHHYQLRAATNDYIAELKAQDEPLDLAQVLPPRVSPEENSADTIRKVAVLFKTNHSLLSTNTYSNMKMVAPGKAMVCSQQPVARDYNVTNSWDEVEAALDKNKEAIALLQTIVEKPNFDFGINYQDGIIDLNFTNLCLVELKQAALNLSVATLVDLHRRDSASAVENTRAMLAITRGMREQRLMITELVRMVISQIAMTTTWEILQSTNVTEEQLAALQKDWASLEFFRSEETALEMERATGAISLQKWRNSNSKLMHYFPTDEEISWMDLPKTTIADRIRLMSRVVRWRYWWSYPDELRTLKGYQALLSAPRAASTNYALLAVRDDLGSNIAKLSISDAGEYYGASDPMKVDLHFLLSSSIHTLGNIINRTIKIEAEKNMVITAIAIKRYRLKHVEYPANLAALVPEFLPEIPRDPIDGQPLRYQRNSDGTFRLYSIGDDGKDDGGDPTPSEKHKESLAWQYGRDWVWTQPATADEIKKFYDNPPK